MTSESSAAHTPVLSAVVPTRDRPGILERLFDSIAAQDRVADIEIVIVDDGSTEPLCDETLASMTPPALEGRVRKLRHEQSLGMCEARNTGWRAARGSFVLFLDDDVEFVGTDLVSRLIAFADSYPEYGVIALAELAPDGSWGFNLGPDGPPLEVARFLGCAALFRRQVLETAGGFLGPLQYYYDEFELSMRVIDAGWRIVFQPSMRVVHHRDPRGRDNRRNARLLSRNALLAAAVRFPLWMLPPALAAQIAKFTLRCWLQRPFDLAGPLFATANAAIRLPVVLPQRRTLQSQTLRRYRRLARQPIPLDCPPPTPSASSPEAATNSQSVMHLARETSS